MSESQTSTQIKTKSNPTDKQIKDRKLRELKSKADNLERLVKVHLLEQCGYKIDKSEKGKKKRDECYDILFIISPSGDILYNAEKEKEYLKEKREDKSEEYFNKCKLLQSGTKQQMKKLMQYKVNNLMNELLECEGYNVEEKDIRKGGVYSSYYPFVVQRIMWNGEVVYQKLKGEEAQFNGQISQVESFSVDQSSKTF